MTDTEIIKALECCTTEGAKCSDCPAFNKVDRSNCKKYFRGAIDLIKSKKADTERHAHWEHDLNIYGEKIVRCSNCRDIFRYYKFQNYNYCSNCGCKMDVEVTK